MCESASVSEHVFQGLLAAIADEATCDCTTQSKLWLFFFFLEDLFGFTQWFMSWAAFHVTHRMVLPALASL